MSVSEGIKFHLFKISWPRFILKAHRQNSGWCGVPQNFRPYSSTPLSSRYVQFVKYCLTFWVFIASSKVSFLCPSSGILSRRLARNPWLERCVFVLLDTGLLNDGSKLSSWFPAITSLCLCGSVPSHSLNSTISGSFPHAEKSPAWIKISPSGTSNFRWRVNAWVSKRIEWNKSEVEVNWTWISSRFLNSLCLDCAHCCKANEHHFESEFIWPPNGSSSDTPTSSSLNF